MGKRQEELNLYVQFLESRVGEVTAPALPGDPVGVTSTLLTAPSGKNQTTCPGPRSLTMLEGGAGSGAHVAWGGLSVSP